MYTYNNNKEERGPRNKRDISSVASHLIPVDRAINRRENKVARRSFVSSAAMNTSPLHPIGPYMSSNEEVIARNNNMPQRRLGAAAIVTNHQSPITSASHGYHVQYNGYQQIAGMGLGSHNVPILQNGRNVVVVSDSAHQRGNNSIPGRSFQNTLTKIPAQYARPIDNKPRSVWVCENCRTGFSSLELAVQHELKCNGKSSMGSVASNSMNMGKYIS